MRRIGTLLRLAAAVVWLHPGLNAAAREVKRYTAEQFMATTSLSGASFSKDETRILFSSNESGSFNAYAIPVDGGRPVAMARPTADSTYAVGFFQTDDRVLFTRDSGGNENSHLFVRELDGAEKNLTPGASVKASFAGWRADGSAFYVRTNERDPRFFDLYRYDAATYARTLVYKNDTGMNVETISGDGRWLALQKSTTSFDSDIHLYDTATGAASNITPHSMPASFAAATFDPQSRRLYFTTNEGGEFSAIRTYDIATGMTAERERAGWDLISTAFSRDGRYRSSVVNQDGSVVVRVVEGADEKPVLLPQLPGGEIRHAVFSPSARLMAFYLNGDRTPANLYVHDFRTGWTRQLTESLNKEVDRADLVEAAMVRFASFDGTVIPSVYYRPRNASAANKAPALVWVHGGPGGQAMRGYSAQIQYLVNHGYAVLAINNRGSSGYGKTFFTADDRRHGREPLWDCIEAKAFLASLGHVDPQRIGIAGGSYGGYMVLAALTFRPEVFRVGVDFFGVSNWIRTLESIPPYWESQRGALYDEIGDPVADRAMLTAISPLFHADRIRRPLMVVQGANDPRVIKAESDEIVAAVRANNVPVDYLVFADEGHGFSKKHNQVAASARMLSFLDRYLKP
ncbi:MAG: S9 family peptidase [Pseudomonadota bacterium]